MPKYKLIVEEVNTAVIEVEADDEYQAEDIAMEMWGSGDLDGLFSHDVSVTVEY